MLNRDAIQKEKNMNNIISNSLANEILSNENSMLGLKVLILLLKTLKIYLIQMECNE